MRTMRWLQKLIIVVVAASLAASVPSYADKKKKSSAEEDSTMKLIGGAEGTIFKSLRVEGEDRVRIEFDRPALKVDLDPASAPGLDWESIHTVLNRDGIDLMSPFLARSTAERPPYYARPWLDELATGPVARFRPNLEGVDRWRLTVANSQGETVANFEGKGKPPKQIEWDGRTPDGKPVPPGLTYSYVLEAFDRAGNKRNFVGEGFELPSYRLDSPNELAMLFSGAALDDSRGAAGTGVKLPAPILLEAASWINQRKRANEPVRIIVTARTFDDAKGIANRIETGLRPLLLGDPSRLQGVTRVNPEAPERGTVAIAVSAASQPDAN